MNNSDLVRLMYEAAPTNYVFGGSRYTMKNTDCSGMVDGAFWQLYGISPFTVGTYTGDLWAFDFLDFVWYGYSPDLPYEDMIIGDVIFTSNVSPNFSSGNGSHVGFYTGDPNNPFISHFANNGPFVTAVNGVYGGTEKYYGIKRYSKGAEDMKPSDVWDYNWNNTAPEGNAYNCLLGIYRNAQPHNFWEYDYEGTAPEGNVYNCLMDIHRRIKALENLSIEPVTVDYAKLAKLVADELAKRLKE